MRRPRSGSIRLTIKGNEVDKMFSALYRISRDESLFDPSTLEPPTVWYDRLVDEVRRGDRIIRELNDPNLIAHAHGDGDTGNDEAESVLQEGAPYMQVPVSRPVNLQDFLDS